MRFFRHLSASVIACAFVFIIVSSVFAVGVKPLRNEIRVTPGGTATATITVINSDPTPVNVRPVVNMYAGNDASGYPIESKLPTTDPQHLANWVTFDTKDIALKPNGSKDVRITITAPKNAEPGGHYGALIYEPIVTSKDDAVTVHTRVASLLLITVDGAAKRAGALKNFTLPIETLKGDDPLAFTVEFENTGTVHLKPTGTITIAEADTPLTKIARYLDPNTGKEVIADAIPVNLLGGNVLPKSSRVFSAAWTECVRSGTFTATLALTYADGMQPITKTTSFTVKDALDIDDFALEHDAKHATLLVRLTNDSNVKERLQGTIDVMNDFDFKVAEVAIPATVAYINPGETQTIEIPWLQKAIPSGSYEARLSAVYGFTKTPLTAKTSFSSEASYTAAIAGGIGGITLVGLVIGGYVFFVRKRIHTHRRA